MTIQDLITRCGGQTKAAKIASVHRQTAHHWYHGRLQPHWQEFMAMCCASETDPHRVTAPESSRPQHRDAAAP